VNLPVIICNFPNFSGVNLTVEQVSEFFADDRFIGIRHTSNGQDPVPGKAGLQRL